VPHTFHGDFTTSYQAFRDDTLIGVFEVGDSGNSEFEEYHLYERPGSGINMQVLRAYADKTFSIEKSLNHDWSETVVIAKRRPM